jgi:excisionase family DNA binding protein
MAAKQDLLTVEEAGRALGVSVSTVWRRVRSGEVPSIRRGGRRLIPKGAIALRSTRMDSADIPVFDEDHPIFRLAGAARGGGKKPGARDKHAILDD